MRMLMLATIMAVMGSQFLLTGAEAKQDGPHRTVEVIPEPRQVAFNGGGFPVANAQVIRVTDTTEGRFAARLLRDALRDALGIECSIEPILAGSSGAHELILAEADQSALPATPPAVKTGKEKEGYGLSVDGRGVCISAPTEAGLFYGIQTLIQLSEQAARRKTSIPGMAVSDWPEFDFRSAAYIEGSQVKDSVIISRAEIEQSIRRLAKYKMNCLVVEIYNLAPFASFPYCANANTLSKADWEYLVEFGRKHHVTIMPSLQSFGQIAEVIWNNEEGKPYRESTVPGLLCPSRPENITFLKGLYKDLLKIFKTTPYLGIGCSEVWMQWNKKYCPLCQARIDAGETEWDIYCGHVLNCIDAVNTAARETGRDVRPIIWADEFYMYNLRPRYAGLEKMPKQAVLGHWQYFDKYWVLDNRHYDGIEGLTSRGFDVMFVSACWPANTYLVDLSPDDPTDGKFPLIVDSGVLNITDQARWAQAYQAKGGPGKVIGGLCATFSQHDIRCWDTTWLGYALQGDYTWGDPSRPWNDRKKPFVHDFAASFYAARDERTASTITQAFWELDAAKSDIERNHYLIRDIIGEYDAADEAYIGNSLDKSCKLIRELMDNPKGEGKTATDVRTRAEKVLVTARKWEQRLSKLDGQVGNPQSLGYLVTAAHKMRNHAVRTLYMLDQEELLAELDKAGNDPKTRLAMQKIKALQTRLAALTADTQGLLDGMRKLTWFTDDYATGYYQVMPQLAEFEKRLDEVRDKNR